MKYLRNVWPYVPYLALSLVVLGPLLLPGYVLTMDMVFTPELRLPDHVDNTWLMYALLHTLDIVLPADLVQKMILLSCLLLSGVGMHRMLLAVEPQGQPLWHWAAYVGGSLYMVNPFVYDRLMAGQWGVWLGYALLPWFAARLLKLVRSPGRGNALRLCAWLVAMSIVSVHSVGYAVVLMIVAAAAHARDRQRLRQLLPYGCLVVGLYVLASLYWLVPALLGRGRIADSLATFAPAGQQAFTTVDAISTGQVGALLGMLGFWQETRGLYAQPIESYLLWGLVYLALLALIALGAWQAWRRQRGLALCAGAVGSAGLVLALGGGNWLAHYVPFFAGYREPQKFVALLILVYGYFVTWGTAWLMSRGPAWRQKAILVALILLPLAYTPTLLWGAAGQLHTTDYPADWFKVRQLLNRDKGKVLILPWHLYMSYSFSHERIIASPARGFFGANAAVSDDPELPGVAPQTRDPVREAVQGDVLSAATRGEPVEAKLRQLGIGSVLLSKDLEWQAQESIATGAGAQLVYDGPTLRLYKLTK